MKKIPPVITLLMVLAILISACELPAPGSAPPTPEVTSEVQTEPKIGITVTQLPPVGEFTPAGEVVTATPLPPAVTATPLLTRPPTVPTATALPQATAPAATRIQFKPGATSGTVEGELSAGQTVFYVLGAESGQRISIEIQSPNEDVYLGLSGVSTGQVLVLAADRLTEWSGILPGAQDYYISVTASGGRTSYTIDLELLPADATPLPAMRFDPYVTYGEPDYIDPFIGGSLTEWARPEDGTLPDDNYIRLQFKDAKLYVTGKQLGFSTWWFTWHSLKDFYLEMTFDTEDCSGKDAYGIILRGPEHKAGVSYGYVVAFSCDGSYWVFRLDGVDPWDAEDLIAWSKSEYINAGSDKQNVIGVHAVGNTITVYANGYPIAEVKDDEYSSGRFGVFVSPAVTQLYTYRVTKIAYWEIEER